MPDSRLHTLTFAALCLAMVGCGGPDYDAENFAEFKQEAESDPEGNIDVLKRFVHANPEHPEALLLLGRTLLETAGNNEDQIYVARYYLKRAMQQDVNGKVADQAADAYMQARLTQNSDAGGPEAVVDLADYARGERPARAVELYLEAARGYLERGGTAEALTQARTARSLILELPAQQSDARELYLARWILAAISTGNGDYEAASRRLTAMAAMEVDPTEWEEKPQYLPEVGLLGAVNAFIREAGADGMISSMTKSVSDLWSGDGDDSNQQAALEDVVLTLEKADRANRRMDNRVRDQLSGRIWATLAANIAERYEDLRGKAKENARFYYRRAGDEAALEELD